MKIHHNLPVNSQATRKTKRAGADGVFKSMFESEVEGLQAVADTPQPSSDSATDSAWQSLGDSISLLDQAMQCLKSGDSPSTQLIDDIDQLRAQLHAQMASDEHAHELRQADTLLAVEAERIRSLQS